MTHLTGFACPPVRRASRRGALYRKRSATPRAVKQTRPSVARSGPPGALRPCPMRVYRAADRACPADRCAPSNGSLSTILGISYARRASRSTDPRMNAALSLGQPRPAARAGFGGRALRAVQVKQPIERKPWASSGWRGRSWRAKWSATKAGVQCRKGLTLTRGPSPSKSGRPARVAAWKACVR